MKSTTHFYNSLGITMPTPFLCLDFHFRNSKLLSVWYYIKFRGTPRISNLRLFISLIRLFSLPYSKRLRIFIFLFVIVFLDLLWNHSRLFRPEIWELIPPENFYLNVFM